MMRTEVIVALLAGLFGLAPIMLQVATARAQRKDTSTRLNSLRAELEFLERLGALHEQVVAGGDPARLQTKLGIGDAASDLLDQYKALPRADGPSLEGARRSSERTPDQLPFLRRALLMYAPETLVGWALHTIFYVLAAMLTTGLLLTVVGLLEAGEGSAGTLLIVLAFFGIVFGLPLLLIQRLARRYGDRPEAAASP